MPPRSAHPGVRGVRDVLDGDEVREILRDTFFTATPPEGVTKPVVPQQRNSDPPEGRKRGTTAPARTVKPRPEHYKVICISIYTEDLERLDAAVTELKRRGYTKANRSAVLRAAMDQLDLDRVPKGL